MTKPPHNARPHVRHVAHHVEELAQKFDAMHNAASTAATDAYASAPAPPGNGSSRTNGDAQNGAQR